MASSVEPLHEPLVEPRVESRVTAPPVVTNPARDARERFFCTEHIGKDLRQRTVRGGVVTLSAQLAKFLLRLGSTALLARLLTPADFGLIAMVTVVTGFVEMFKDAGLSMATVQRERITHDQVSTLFWINVALSAGIMLIIAAMAPVVSWFYGDQRLVGITLALSGTMIFSGLAVQHQALLRRKMQFAHLAAIEITSMAVGILTAIIMAWQGFSYWALVGMTAGTSATTAAMSFLMSGWLPGLPARGSGVRPMLAFGGNLTGFSFVNYFARNADNFLIGLWWGAGPLGLYSKAYGLLMLPINQFTSPISAVILPALSRLKGDPQRYKRYYFDAVMLCASVGMPLVVYCAVMANELVWLVLGEQWMDSVPIFRALIPVALLGTLSAAPGWAYMSLGQTGRMFRWSLLSTPVVVLGMSLGLPYGALGVAHGCSIAFCCTWLYLIPYCFRGTFLKPRDFVKAIIPPALASVVAGGAAAVCSRVMPLNHLPALAIAAIVFLAAYLLSWHAMPAGRSRLASVLSRSKQGPSLSCLDDPHASPAQTP